MSKDTIKTASASRVAFKFLKNLLSPNSGESSDPFSALGLIVSNNQWFRRRASLKKAADIFNSARFTVKDWPEIWKRSFNGRPLEPLEAEALLTFLGLPTVKAILTRNHLALTKRYPELFPWASKWQGYLVDKEGGYYDPGEVYEGDYWGDAGWFFDVKKETLEEALDHDPLEKIDRWFKGSEDEISVSGDLREEI
ncbi:MAG: hypothetical protein GF334_07470, partial [Candidatus Altiarchaeales archaeon]|nr:hypothetical protein [Candidatus Altiarchaeales archaeon]